MKVKIFFCYAHEDESLLTRLKTHLKSLEREGLIEIWHDRDISAGLEWKKEIHNHLDIAQIILLLISPDFMASDYCFGIEMKRALERHKLGEARVIPVILRPGHWEIEALQKLQALPTDAKPITGPSWHSEDAAFFDVTSGIRNIVNQLSQPRLLISPSLISDSPTSYTSIAMPIRQSNSLATNTPVLPQSVPAVIPTEWVLLHTLAGHSDRVTSIAISPDRQTLVSGSWDCAIKLWNLQTGELLHTFGRPSDAVMSVTISRGGQMLASGNRDTTIKLWYLHTGELQRTLEGHSDAVMSVAISEDGQMLASGSLDRTVKLWNLQTGAAPLTLQHTDRVVSVAISSDEEIVAGGSIDKTIKLWNLNTGRLMHTLEGHSDAVLSIAISLDGQTLVSGSLDGTIKLWNLHTGRFLRTLDEHSGCVLGIALDGDGQTLVRGSWNRTVKLWNLRGRIRLLWTFEGLSEVVTSVALSYDGRILAIGNWDHTISIWGRQLVGGT